MRYQDVNRAAELVARRKELQALERVLAGGNTRGELDVVVLMDRGKMLKPVEVTVTLARSSVLTQLQWNIQYIMDELQRLGVTTEENDDAS